MVVILTVVLSQFKPPLPHTEAQPLADMNINNQEQVDPKQDQTLSSTVNGRSPDIQEPLGEVPKPSPEPIQQIRVFCGSPKQRNFKTPIMENVVLGEQLAKERGWVGAEWKALLELWSCESSWTTTVGNTEGSGAYGIPQALPAHKMAVNGEDYLTNPRTQIMWGLDYIASRYGNPSTALAFHYKTNWY